MHPPRSAHVRNERGRAADHADVRQLAVERARVRGGARLGPGRALALLPAALARRRALDPRCSGDLRRRRRSSTSASTPTAVIEALRDGRPNAGLAGPDDAQPPARRRAARAARAALGAARRRRVAGACCERADAAGCPGRPDVRADGDVLAGPDDRRAALLHGRAPRRRRRDHRDGPTVSPTVGPCSHRRPRRGGRRARSPCSAARDDTIITGGENVAPTRVEAVLEGASGGGRGGVLARADEPGGRRSSRRWSCAGATRDRAELQEYCRERLARGRCRSRFGCRRAAANAVRQAPAARGQG